MDPTPALPDEAPPGDAQPDGVRRQLPLWQESILLLGVALALAIVIKAVFLQAFSIPSESMEPGLVKDDRILVQKVSYWGGGEPQRGDVVVFEDPGGWLNAAESAEPTDVLRKVLIRIGLYPAGGHLVKRVIGVAGDVIECCDDQGRISVNGQPLDEDGYIKEQGLACNGPMVDQCTADWKAGSVPEGHVFVMGDNRGDSADSSYHLCKPTGPPGCEPGPEFVADDLVVGRVFLMLRSWTHADLTTRPDSFADVPDA